MTTLLVTPIDWTAPGSFRKRSKLMRAIALTKSTSGADTAAAYIAVEDIVLSQLETDDGSSVEEALDQLSAEQFDSLLEAMAGDSTVPQESAGT